MTVWKEPADVATTDDLGIAFPSVVTIDGVTLNIGNRVLVKDQLTSTENGYYVVVGIPGAFTLTATGETMEAEDVIRVSKGDRNAHTTWSLIDATKHIFVCQDIKHYSIRSIDALKQFWQVLPDATATVAGYAEPGDKGGGDFTFIGAPDYARVVSAKSFDIAIDNVTNVDGLVTIAVNGHGLGDPPNITRAYIKGLDGLVDAAYYVKVIDTNTLTLPGYFTGVSFVANAKIQYVKLVTKEAHKRANSQRVSVIGVMPIIPPDGAVPAASIPRINDGCGIIDDISISIPISTIGGTYKISASALIGDDALVVPATDTEDNVGGLWQRLRADHIDVRWFGAKGDWQAPGDRATLPLEPTDDLPAFNAAIAALGTRFPLSVSSRFFSSTRKAGKVVAEGFFYLSSTLHITRAVELVGAGNNTLSSDGGPWRPATVLAFTPNTTGIRIHSEFPNDSPDGGSGSQAAIRDLMMVCIKPPDNWAEVPDSKGHGIHASTTFSSENINIENFWGNGINIVGGPLIGPEAGSADRFYIINCNIASCAGHGVYVLGNASVGLVARTTAIVCQGWGFFDESSGGNTYIACQGEGNLGHRKPNEVEGERSYKTLKGGTNCSIFIGCYSEGSRSNSQNEINRPGMVLGGILAGSSSHVKNSTAFLLQSGLASREPLAHVRENEENPLWRFQVDIGARPDLNLLNALSINLENQARSIILRLMDEPQEGAPLPNEPTRGWLSFLHDGTYHLMQLPLTVKNLRRWAPQFRQGIFYHSGNTPTQLVSHSAGSGVADPIEGTWEQGDLIWNEIPKPGEPIGRVCIVSGIQGTPNPATFSTFGVVETVSTSYPDNQLLKLTDRYVTVTATEKTMTLPASPVDGQTHSIKSKVGVITTIETADGTPIDAAPTAIVGSLEYRNFRYSSATNEWEIR